MGSRVLYLLNLNAATMSAEFNDMSIHGQLQIDRYLQLAMVNHERSKRSIIIITRPVVR